MKAIQYTAFGTRPKLVEVDKPSPGPGEVLLRITASGLCHSDEFVMMMPEEGYPYPMPMTLATSRPASSRSSARERRASRSGSRSSSTAAGGAACVRCAPTGRRTCA